jgi:integrase
MTGRNRGRGTLKRGKDSRGRTVYVADWTGADGRRHRKVLSSDKQVAGRMLAKLVRDRDLADGGLVIEEGQERLLSEIKDKYLASDRRPAYSARVCAHLERLCAEMPGARVRDVTPDRVMEWRRKRLAAGLSNRTVNVETGSAKTCLTWAVRARLVSANPLAGLKPLPMDESTLRKQRRALTEEEIGRLLREAENEDADRAAFLLAERTLAGGSKGESYALRDRREPIPQAPFFKVILATGLRYGEAAALQWSDFDADAGCLVVRATNAKGKRARVVTLAGYLIELLTALPALHGARLGYVVGPADPIFRSPKGAPLTPGNSANLLKLFGRILQRAKIPNPDERGRTLDLHALRTTAATRLLRHGVELALVAEILGHRDVRLTLKHYTDLRLSDALSAMGKLPALEAAPPETGAEAASAVAVGSNLAMRRGGRSEPFPRAVARRAANLDGSSTSRRGLESSPKPSLLLTCSLFSASSGPAGPSR